MEKSTPEDALRIFFPSLQNRLVAAYLFGSEARGTSRPDSDVDVAVLYSDVPPAVLNSPASALEGALERFLGRPVEVVVLNSAPVDFVHRVFLEARLVFEGDPSARIAFEVKSRSEYFDLLPILRRYRRLRERSLVTDPDLIAKKLAQIETCVRELRSLAQPDRIRQDIREQRFVKHTLQLAIQAALDAASQIVSDERLGEPWTNRELFDLLERAGWIAPELAAILRDMVGFRNILVHGYDTVNLQIVEDVVRNRLDDLLEFAVVIRRRLPAV